MDIKKTISSLLDSIYIEEKDNLAIIDCGKKALQIDKILNDIIKTNNLTNRLSYIDDSSISKSFTKSILLIKLGITSKNDILEIRKQLNLIGVKNLGFIAIEGLDINQKDDLEEIILYTKNKYLLLIKQKINIYYL